MKIRSRLLFSLLLLTPVFSAGKEQPVKTKSELAAAVRYKIPAGWTEEFSINQGDPQARLSRSLHRIKVRLSGGNGSRYKTAGDFLAGFEALSKGGTKSEKIGTEAVSGARVLLYRREIAVTLPPPDTAGPATFTREEFCVVPAGKRFLVLSYSYGDSIPDLSYDGFKVWREFLKGFQVLKEKKPGK
ncbi:MAG: hypothetical protein WCW52_09725 [Elusimicrobiales bacterium]|jgi:hypothetical protein